MRDRAKTRRMGWSFRIARVAGIDVRVHVTFLLLLAWIAANQAVGGAGLGAALTSVLLVLCVFAIVVLHELAHALTARRFGVQTRDITLLPIGGVSSLERIPDKPRQELLIALAGPSLNLLIALVLFALLVALRGPLAPSDVPGTTWSFMATLMWLNVGLALFNLLPAFPMDGGRILRAALALRLSYDRATSIAATLGQLTALAFGLVGLFYNPILVLIAVFVWVGARQESALVSLRSSLAGIPVRRAMITEFATLSPAEPLSRAVERTLAGFQGDFPVVDSGRLMGLVTREDLLRGLAADGPDATVAQALGPEVTVVRASDPLDSALAKIGPRNVAVVLDGDALVGLLTAENIAELFLLQRVMRRRSGPGAVRPATV